MKKTKTKTKTKTKKNEKNKNKKNKNKYKTKTKIKTKIKTKNKNKNKNKNKKKKKKKKKKKRERKGTDKRGREDQLSFFFQQLLLPLIMLSYFLPITLTAVSMTSFDPAWAPLSMSWRPGPVGEYQLLKRVIDLPD